MKPDYKGLITTMTDSIIANQGRPQAIGTLEAFLWMVLEDIPQDQSEFWVKLLKETTENQG